MNPGVIISEFYKLLFCFIHSRFKMHVYKCAQLHFNVNIAAGKTPTRLISNHTCLPINTTNYLLYQRTEMGVLCLSRTHKIAFAMDGSQVASSSNVSLYQQ